MGIDLNDDTWHTKDRSETAYVRMQDRTMQNGTVVENPALGINIYKKAFNENDCLDIINTLDHDLESPEIPFFWEGARVTESKETLTDARDCVDFKIGQGCLGPKDQYNENLYRIHQNSFDRIHPHVQDYGNYWGVGMNYYEVFNYVKYEGAGKHFKVHADHGPAYVTTVSAVAYLNDDYVGGELIFPRFGLTIKPEVGDLVVFPSTFIYEHSSEPIISGTKYSIVVMTDYNSRGGGKYFDYTSEQEKLIY